MKVAFITNIRSPYRKLQIEKFTTNPHLDINVFYTDKDYMGRSWNVEKIKNVSEKVLSYTEIIDVVKKHDVLFVGGYEKIKYISLSFLCKLYKKPFVLIYDGIDPTRIFEEKHILKDYIKEKVITNSAYVFGNGQVSQEFFSRRFNYPISKIFNQYLCIDNESITRLLSQKLILRETIRASYNIPLDKRVLVYSGRLIKRKNVDQIIHAISNLKNSHKYTLLILGDGEEKNNLIELAEKKNVHLVITGFITEQSELFKHYYAGDLLILPSFNEPWGLVVNEAMAAGLPVIVSKYCGSAKDLVIEGYNGAILSDVNHIEISNILSDIDENKMYETYGLKSLEIIKEWNFENSYKKFMEIIKSVSEER